MMKTPLCLCLLIGRLTAVCAQHIETARYIDVTAKADTVLTPTMYYFGIEPVVPEDPYTDYATMSKGDRFTVLQKHKERLAEIGRQIKSLLAQEGVTENDYIRKKYNLESEEAAYLLLKVDGAAKLDRIVERLRAPKFCKGEVVAVYSAGEAEARKELQVKALRKARAQAARLLAEAGARPGPLMQMTDRAEVSEEVYNNTSNYDSGEYTLNRKVFNGAAFATVHDARFESVLNKSVYLSQTVEARFLIE